MVDMSVNQNDQPLGVAGEAPVKEIICDYCGRTHLIPFDTPIRLCIFYRDGFDNEYISPFTALDVTGDEEGGIGTEIWLEDLFTKERLEKYDLDKENHGEVIDDEDIERALYRIYGKKYKKVSEDDLGEIWERVE